MWKVTLEGLVAHKLRFVLTGIAVILGVAFISGTFVFTATIQQTFDDLFGDIYKGTDAVVRRQEAFRRSGLRRRGRGDRSPPSLVPTRRGAEACAAADGADPGLRAARRQEGQGDRQSRAGRAHARLRLEPDRKLNQFHLVPGAAHRDRRRDRDRQGQRRQRPLQGRRHGDGAHQGRRARTTRSSASSSFGTADNLAGASVIAVHRPQAQRIAGTPGKFDYIGVVAKPGVSQDQVAPNIRTRAEANPARQRSR